MLLLQCCVGGWRVLAGTTIVATLVGCGATERGRVTEPPVARGSLVVRVTGLAADAPPSLDLKSTGFDRLVVPGDTIRNLAEGEYTLIASAAEDARARFQPSPERQTFTLSAGAPTTVSVAYAQVTGGLVLGIDGLPPTQSADVAVTGPQGFTTRITQTDTLYKLDPGEYQIAGQRVGAAIHFLADSAARSVRVDSGNTESLVVHYHEAALLSVAINGLPDGAAGSVDVRGASFAQHLDRTTTLDLPLGNYDVIPSVVTVGTDAYVALQRSVTVSSGASDTVDITYARRSGTLTFQVDGGPIGLGSPNDPIVTVQLPTGSVSFSSDTTFTGLPLGSYSYSVRAPRYTIFYPDGVLRVSDAVKYSTPLDGQANLAVELDASQSAATVQIPLRLVTGAVTFVGDDAPPLPPGGGLGAYIELYLNGVARYSVLSGQLTIVVDAGTYATTAGPAGNFPNTWWPDQVASSLTISPEHPFVAVRQHYHQLVWPTVKIDYAGMPRIGWDVFYDGDVIPLPRTYTGTASFDSFKVLPGAHELKSLGWAISGDTAAWTAAQPTIDFNLAEGEIKSIVVQMVPTNIIKMVVNTPVQIPSGKLVMTYPDGHTQFDIGTEAFPSTAIANQPVGTYVVNATPFDYQGTTYEADQPSQSATVTATGSITFTVQYHEKTP